MYRSAAARKDVFNHWWCQLWGCLGHSGYWVWGANLNAHRPMFWWKVNLDPNVLGNRLFHLIEELVNTFKVAESHLNKHPEDRQELTKFLNESFCKISIKTQIDKISNEKLSRVLGWHPARGGREKKRERRKKEKETKQKRERRERGEGRENAVGITAPRSKIIQGKHTTTPSEDSGPSNNTELAQLFLCARLPSDSRAEKGGKRVKKKRRNKGSGERGVAHHFFCFVFVSEKKTNSRKQKKEKNTPKLIRNK